MLSFVMWVFSLYKISTEIGLFMFFCSVCFPSECVQGVVAHTVISALGKKRKVPGQPQLCNKVPSESASFLFTLKIFLIVCVSVPEEAIRCSGAGVTDSFEPLAGTPTQVL